MKIDELLMMGSRGAAPKKKRCGKRGRVNTSTGHRGISLRNDFRADGSARYQVYSLTTPTVYIGTVDTVEKGLRLQATFEPKNQPADCSSIKGVIWAHNGYRARFVKNYQVYQRQGFVTPEAAADWLREEKARHGFI